MGNLELPTQLVSPVPVPLGGRHRLRETTVRTLAIEDPNVRLHQVSETRDKENPDVLYFEKSVQLFAVCFHVVNKGSGSLAVVFSILMMSW